MKQFGQVLKKLRSGKLLAVGAVLVASLMVFGTSNVASAAPSYFDVDKPSSSEQCNGYTSTWKWEWRWERNTDGPWWTWFFFGHWVRVEHRTPNWRELGFSSKGQCVRYTSTEVPQTRADCRQGEWWRLGFNSRNQCVNYARIFGGGGYGGNGS